MGKHMQGGAPGMCYSISDSGSANFVLSPSHGGNAANWPDHSFSRWTSVPCLTRSSKKARRRELSFLYFHQILLTSSNHSMSVCMALEAGVVSCTRRV